MVMQVAVELVPGPFPVFKVHTERGYTLGVIVPLGRMLSDKRIAS